MRPLFKDVYHYADSGHECDFVVCDRRKVESLTELDDIVSSGVTVHLVPVADWLVS